MKRVLSISQLILPLLALASAPCLSAQTLVVDKPTLSFSAQAGGSAVSQTLNITSSNGAATPFTLSYPSYPWLKVNNQLFGFAGTTPASLTVTADPAGLAAGTISASIVVTGGAASVTPIAVTFTVSAIGVSPASLAFAYTAGSNTFPNSQFLTLSGAVTQCTATAAATTGGAWFSISPQNSCVSPGAINVLINSAVVSGLAPATYNGTITVTPSPAGQSPAVVVPLTLTVSPTPPVTVNPAALIFNFQSGIAAANPSQILTISTTSSQTLSYSITATADNAGTWISTVSPPSGSITGSVQITVTLNPNGLAAGTYTGHLSLFTPGGSPTQTNIPITLNVSATPLLNVPNATLNFSFQLGTSAPAAQSVNITATSGAPTYSVTTSNYSPSANSTWLVAPNSGTTAAPLSVSVNPTGLLPGTYSATINVTAATPGSAAQSIPVVLKVSNDPVISASVTSLGFPFQIGQTAPGARSVKVTSSGVPLNYSASLATTTCGNAWLLLNSGTNAVNGVTDDTLSVSVATAGLAVATTCNGTLTITATNPATGAAAVNSPVTIPVTLTVSTTAQLVLTPANPPVFTAAVGAASPAPQSITLTSTSTDVLNYTVAFQSTGGNWLFVAPLAGSTAAGNILTVSVIPGGLTAGTYNGTVTVTATNLTTGAAVANSPVTIPVTLTVTAGSLTLSAADLSFAQTLGGPAPAAQTVTIGSSTSTALNFTAVANSNNTVTWLSVSPATGNTASSGVLSVTVDGSKLTPGTYNGTILVNSPGAGNSPATVNVHLQVNPGTISAPTTTLTFTQAVGGSVPATQTIAVTGSPAPLNFTVAAATVTGANWLTATPATATTPASVQVAVNGATLAVGQYTGTVTITSAGASGSPIAVGVVLNVVPAATLAATPTSLSFAYIIGQAGPLPQNVSVTASGTTVGVPVTAQVQFDGAPPSQWLNVTATSANAPTTLAVAVSPSTLPAGQYTGRVIITSPNATAAVNVAVTLTVTAIPKPVVVAIKNAANYFTGNLSPGENIVIGGTGLGPLNLANGTVTNNAWTTVVANTRVLFDNVAAPIIYASDGLTSVMVPYGVGGRTATNIVVEYFGVQSTPVTYNVSAAVPGIYTLNSQGTGPAAILNQNFAINGPGTPEKRGNVIAVYMTGEGATNPVGADGVIITGSTLKKPLLTVTATIGGITAVVQYAGSAPGIVSGVMQVNLLIPDTAPVGSAVPIVINVGTASTASAGAPTVAIQ